LLLARQYHFNMKTTRDYINHLSFINIWLIFLLYGCGQSANKLFTNIDPLASGIDFRNDIQETQHNNILRNEYTYNGGGVAVGDVNNDGWADVYFTGNSVSNKLYLNRGDWKFEDITIISGTGGRKDWATGVVMVDVNGDGWLDIYVCYSGNTPGEGYNQPVIRDHPGRANQLFINNGCKPGEAPTFTERAREFGLDAPGTFSNQAYFFDYDQDGDLDMFLLNHANTFYAPFINTKRLRSLRHPYYGNKLFRNDHMQFVEVSEEAGIHGGGLNFGLSASIADINLDNWPDIYVTNDYDEQDFCYINNQDGTFREVSREILGHMSKSSMGSDVADINNNGYPDILVSDMLAEDNYRQKILRGQDSYERYQLAVDSGFQHQFSRNTLQLNRGLKDNGLPIYSEIGQFAGISNTDWSWSTLLVDLDNDGYRDIFISNGYLKDITNMDNMMHTAEVYKMANERKVEVDYLMLIKNLQSTKLKNYVFRNQNGISFTNMTDKWGLLQKTVSNGAAYADFDNDGDYDLIMNNLNETVSILKNNQDKLLKNNYIKLKLVGSNLNTQGIGAKIWIETEANTIYHEAYNARGYLSSSDLVITIGIGYSKEIKSLKVLWPGGRHSLIQDVEPNNLIEVSYEFSSIVEENFTVEPNQTLLEDVTEKSGITFRHKENDYDDFRNDKLLQYRLSRLGGMLASGDVNNDGNDDVIFGGAAGFPAELYFGNDDGTFSKSGMQPWEKDSLMEDIKPLFFDADNDGDLDLYVVSGGNMYAPGSPQYQDRLYINDGFGQFIDMTNSLPKEASIGSCVVAGDFDNDGDLDLFIGGRHLGSKYPYSPESFILRNETKNGVMKFVNITSEISSSLANIGMVTDAIWTDYDNDGWLDLIVVGEWMRITIFKNENGRLLQQEFNALDNSNGWWTTISQMDIDGDGDLDYLIGNAGLNFQLKASDLEPIELYAADFNNDGKIDPIMCYYIQGKSYPMHSRNELLEQINPLRKKYANFATYANATIEDVIYPNTIDETLHLKAYMLESCWLENIDGDFRLHKLPASAQFSQINSFVNFDYRADGDQIIIASGNFYPFKPQLGMQDASTGTLLQFSKGSLVAINDVLSPVWLMGDIRDMALLSFKSGKKMVAVSRNNDIPGIFAIKDESFIVFEK
jgi:enediyne biosynthesis protein E4